MTTVKIHVKVRRLKVEDWRKCASINTAPATAEEKDRFLKILYLRELRFFFYDL